MIAEKINKYFISCGLAYDEAKLLIDFCISSYDINACFLNYNYLENINGLTKFSEQSKQMLLDDDKKFTVWVGHVLKYIKPEYEYLSYFDMYNEIDANYAGLMCLFSVISGLSYMKKFYETKNIPQEYLYASLSDLNVWMSNAKKTGVIGLHNDAWLAFTMRGLLFKIGCLQFEPSSFNFYNMSKTGYKSSVEKNIPVLAVHLQEGEKLLSVAESLSEAKEFFKQYFSDVSYKAFVCNSWLLDPALLNFLDENSNIIKFMKMFTVLPGKGEPNALISVFGSADVDLNLFSPITSLQKNMKNYLLSGKKVADRFGFILIDDCDE